MNCSSVKVSICSLAYNHAPYIRQCLDSLLNQKTDFRYEILVNDDCSTDGTREILREYATKHPDIIVPIFHEENQFQKGVRGMFQRFLFPKAQGEYLAICEGDDYWCDSLKLQKQVNYMEAHPDCTMCFSRAKVLLEVNSPVYIKCFNIEDRDYSATELFSNWIVPTASMLFRKSAVKYPVTQKERILNGDIVIVEQCAHTGKVHGMSDAMVVYRMQSGGVTYDCSISKNRIMRYPEHYECLKDNFHLIDNALLSAKLAESYYNRAFLQPDKVSRKRDLAKAEEYAPGYCRMKRREKMKNRVRSFFA